ncbi:molybdopterin molybdotransferase MoeA [Prosthecochloris sp. CIB 2401]|uniref:molybdopterin molybdotransferase MoeA n=1 Tax=Prosthecochloris sp. CIB 2401 TaxID=1868325 RepID=UPI00080AA1C9|nr:gephyrin-like molybdotransferase Glp [Prosthecochloris sp. CIB 2401]ANT65885.1 Molybdopterin molybdenumtransferase [Prosthecochloris sp. CIB 2401]
MITVQEAQELIAASVRTLPLERVALEALEGRVLGEDVTAGFALPRFDNAAMDGFAVRWDAIANAKQDAPVTLDVIGEVAAGGSAARVVGDGEALQIMTGAPMPAGADTVVIFEQTSGFGSSTVDVFKAPKKFANVRYAGEEVAEGDMLVRRGSRVTVAEIGVLAAFGMSSVEVFRRPRVGILTVGDELRMPGEPLEGASIYNSNLYSLEVGARSAGAEVVFSRQVSDNPVLIADALQKALPLCDILLTAGGISTGEYDFMQEKLTGLGVRQRFWKIAQKPGKPFFFGDDPDGRLVFGLPGNPLSALVCFLEYVMPALASMQDVPYLGKIEARLASPFPVDRKRYRFLFGRVWQKDGGLSCSPSLRTESHMITSLVGANCLIEAPAGDVPLAEGNVVICNLLPWSSLNA